MLKLYFAEQVNIRSKKLDGLLDLYTNELLGLHDAIIENNKEINGLWESMVAIVKNIHDEMKQNLLLRQHDEILQHEKIISFEQVLEIQLDFQLMRSRKNITFSLLGR